MTYILWTTWLQPRRQSSCQNDTDGKVLNRYFRFVSFLWFCCTDVLQHNRNATETQENPEPEIPILDIDWWTSCLQKEWSSVVWKYLHIERWFVKFSNNAQSSLSRVKAIRKRQKDPSFLPPYPFSAGPFKFPTSKGFAVHFWLTSICHRVRRPTCEPREAEAERSPHSVMQIEKLLDSELSNNQSAFRFKFSPAVPRPEEMSSCILALIDTSTETSLIWWKMKNPWNSSPHWHSYWNLIPSDEKPMNSSALMQFHPLTTTGLAPVAILIVLNVRICRGISILHQRRTSRNRKVTWVVVGKVADCKALMRTYHFLFLLHCSWYSDRQSHKAHTMKLLHIVTIWLWQTGKTVAVNSKINWSSSSNQHLERKWHRQEPFLHSLVLKRLVIGCVNKRSFRSGFILQGDQLFGLSCRPFLPLLSSYSPLWDKEGNPSKSMMYLGTLSL